jgi:hypothetical protein
MGSPLPASSLLLSLSLSLHPPASQPALSLSLSPSLFLPVASQPAQPAQAAAQVENLGPDPRQGISKTKAVHCVRNLVIEFRDLNDVQSILTLEVVVL